jgi:hypothetical protein
MGPIPSDDGEMSYFLDLYICSYTPTLSALIQSHHRDSRFSDRRDKSHLSSRDTCRGHDGCRRHGFIHFACHGALKAGKPFEAGFEPHS